jgi:hypothetical protein
MIKITKTITKNKPKLGLMCMRHILCHAHNFFWTVFDLWILERPHVLKSSIFRPYNIDELDLYSFKNHLRVHFVSDLKMTGKNDQSLN